MAKKNSSNQATLSALLKEKRVFKPAKQFQSQANIKDPKIYSLAKKNPERFWAQCAENLHWYKKWNKTLVWKPPFAKWFIGGKLNACYNCVDRHVLNGNRNKAELIWEGEPGEQRT